MLGIDGLFLAQSHELDLVARSTGLKINGSLLLRSNEKPHVFTLSFSRPEIMDVIASGILRQDPNGPEVSLIATLECQQVSFLSCISIILSD